MNKDYFRHHLNIPVIISKTILIMIKILILTLIVMIQAFITHYSFLSQIPYYVRYLVFIQVHKQFGIHYTQFINQYSVLVRFSLVLNANFDYLSEFKQRAILIQLRSFLLHH
mgnify:CR=1 FL=1